MVEFHTGRLFDHVHIMVSDLALSRKFYEAVFGSINREFTHQGEDHFACDEFWAQQQTGEKVTTGLHLAFQAKDSDAVHRFHRAALAAGGIDNGPPGMRKYHPGYFAAFVLDPDGNNIEVVYHGLSTRSAESVVIKPVT